MPGKRLPMRKIREVMRLKYQLGLPHRSISAACSLGASTISEYVQKAKERGLSWPLPEELDDAKLEKLLYKAPAPATTPHVVPDWAYLHRELKRPGVTVMLLWMEYKAERQDGYSYSRFCELYARWLAKLRPSMRQQHRAGKKTFMDFSGKKPHWVNRETGELVEAELFVGVLGASNYTYAEATASQDLESWVSAHVRMAEYIGGSTELWVPDNLKSGVSKADRYEPEVNRTYAELARHYGAAVVPARSGKPKDKAKVEVGVQIAQRWILARLRHLTFFSLAELNAAIRPLLSELNGRVMKKLGVSRSELFTKLDQPALKALPTERYELAEWKLCRVNIDYHVEVDANFYSVPYQLVREQVEARVTASIVEVYFKGQRVASHQRLDGKRLFSTQPGHMPRSHREYLEWSPSRLISWAEKTGPSTGTLVAEILQRRDHPEQGYRTCLGIMRLGRTHDSARLEAACARAVQLGSYNYRTVKNILSSGQDRLPLDEPTSACVTATPVHDNIRGASYYAGKELPC